MPTLYNVDPLEVGQKFSGTKTVYFNTNVAPTVISLPAIDSTFYFGFSDVSNQENFFQFDVKIFLQSLSLIGGIPESEIPEEDVWMLILANPNDSTSLSLMQGMYSPLYVSHDFTISQAIIDAVLAQFENPITGWTPKTLTAGWQVQQVNWTMAGESTAGLSFGSNTSAEQVNTFASWSEFSETPPASIPSPDWANSFIKTSAGNKAIEKVWIKQNGQLVTVYEAQPTSRFATDTWAQISEACQDGTYKTLYAVGDTKDIVLSTGDTITVAIMGFDHDDLTDGSGKAPITLGMTELLNTFYKMEPTADNSDSWNLSTIRTSTMKTFLTRLPSDLQAIIKTVDKITTRGSKKTSTYTTDDNLFLFSDVEITGTTLEGYASEGVQYEYWKTIKNGSISSDRIKHLQNGEGSADTWWLRSPTTANDSTFRYVYSDGTIMNDLANSRNGVSFGFCVG